MITRNVYLLVGMPGEKMNAKYKELVAMYSGEEEDNSTIITDIHNLIKLKNVMNGYNLDLIIKILANKIEEEIVLTLLDSIVTNIILNVETPSVQLALKERLPKLFSKMNLTKDGEEQQINFIAIPVWTSREDSIAYMNGAGQRNFFNTHYPEGFMEEEYKRHYHTFASLWLKEQMRQREILNPYYHCGHCRPNEYIKGTLPCHAIIVDMDDTMCFNTNGREYVGDEAFLTMVSDEPNYGALTIVKNWINSPGRKCMDTVFILTGRNNEQEKVATFDWWHQWLTDEEFSKVMFVYLGRESDDIRTTKETKEMNFTENIKDRYCVDFMLEDRIDVANIFRDKYGLWVLNPIQQYYDASKL